MKPEDCEVYQLIEAKVRKAYDFGTRALTTKDGREYDEAIKERCMIENCEDPRKCDKLSNTLCSMLPASKGSPTEHANAMSKNQSAGKGNWIPQFSLRAFAKTRRERLYC